MSPDRPISLLISAMGGEGGGVLAGWIISAATAMGFPCQRTSVPGVAQRTGATTYYIEIFPMQRTALAGREPVLSLHPAPGNVDVLLASELVEACRALMRGFVTRERTTLIASTHRVFTIEERAAMGDGRFDTAKALNAINAIPKRTIARDMAALASEAGCHVNAVLLGALAGSGALPIQPDRFRECVRADGKAVDANLRGFDAGVRAAIDLGVVPANVAPQEPARAGAMRSGELKLPEFSREVNAIVAEGMTRLRDYQGEVYATRYLEQVRRFAQRTGRDDVLKSVATHLAVLMSREDVVRVADLKTRAIRQSDIRREVRAEAGDIVHVFEIFKPGVHELAGLLPSIVARPLISWAQKKGWSEHFGFTLSLRSTTVLGFLLLRMLAAMRRFRPYTHAAVVTESVVSRWRALVEKGIELDETLALEIAECARLMKGYGSTYQRGLARFQAIETEVISYGLGRGVPADDLGDAVIQARHAALSDEAGVALKQMIAAFQQATLGVERRRA